VKNPVECMKEREDGGGSTSKGEGRGVVISALASIGGKGPGDRQKEERAPGGQLAQKTHTGNRGGKKKKVCSIYPRLGKKDN